MFVHIHCEIKNFMVLRKSHNLKIIVFNNVKKPPIAKIGGFLMKLLLLQHVYLKC